MTAILIVEDSATQRQRLEHLLKTAGYEVFACSNGAEAFEAICKRPVDLVISDILMPKMTGYDLCRKLKETPQTTDIPVMLLTTLGDPMDVIYALECGAECFITKPYEDAVLINRILDFLLTCEVRRKFVDRASHSPVQSNDTTYFMGEKVVVTANKEQVLGLLLSTFEDIVRTKKELRESKEQLQKYEFSEHKLS